MDRGSEGAARDGQTKCCQRIRNSLLSGAIAPKDSRHQKIRDGWMVARSLFSRYFLGRVAHSEALRPLGCRTPCGFSRVRVLTFLPDRLQILFPIRFLTDGVDSH